MVLKISFEIEVFISHTQSDVPDIEGTVKGVVNFFGNLEPKSIGDTDEDKVYWYMKVFSSQTWYLIFSPREYTSVPEIRFSGVKRSPKDSGSAFNPVIPLLYMVNYRI